MPLGVLHRRPASVMPTDSEAWALGSPCTAWVTLVVAVAAGPLQLPDAYRHHCAIEGPLAEAGVVAPGWTGFVRTVRTVLTNWAHGGGAAAAAGAGGKHRSRAGREQPSDCGPERGAAEPPPPRLCRAHSRGGRAPACGQWKGSRAAARRQQRLPPAAPVQASCCCLRPHPAAEGARRPPPIQQHLQSGLALAYRLSARSSACLSNNKYLRMQWFKTLAEDHSDLCFDTSAEWS